MRKFYQLLKLLTQACNKLIPDLPVKLNEANQFLKKKLFIKACFVLVFCLCNFFVTAGTFYSKASGNANVLATWGLAADGTGTAPTNFTTAGDIFILRVAAVLALNGNWTIGAGVTLQIDGNLNVASASDDITIGGTLIFTSTNTTQVSLTGGGNGNDFIVSPGASLKTANVNGIRGLNCSLPSTASGTISLSTTASYEFNGSTAQASTGLPSIVNNLTINNSTTVTIASLTINGILNVYPSNNFIPSGTITMGNANSAIVNNGALAFIGLTIAATPTAQSQYNASYNVAGLLTVNSGVTFAPTGGTITRTGTGWTTTLTGATVSFYNYTIAGTPATQPTTSYYVVGLLTVNASITLAPSAGTITMFAATSGISNSGTLNFNNLTIATTPTAQTQYNTSYSVAGALTVNSGITFAPTGGTITRTGTAWTTTLTGATVTFYNYTLAGTPATQPTASYSVAGLLTVNAGITLAPTGGTVTMSTTTSSILNSGTLTFNNLSANNASGLAITGNVTVNGVLDFLSGLITPSTSLTIGAAGSITNSTSTKYANGKLNMIFSGASSKTFPIGKGGNYRPVTFEYFSLTGTSTVSFEQFESQMSGVLPAGTNVDANRYWDFSQGGGTTFTYKITLDPTGFTSTGTVVQLKKDAGVITSNATTSPNYTNSTNYTSTSSPTSIAIGSNCSATSSNAGAGQTGAATCGLTSVTLAANTPAFGTGVWTVVSGTGGSFGNASNPSSTFSGTAGNAYNLRWTVTNGNCSANSTVNVTFNISPTVANAGPDQTSSATCGLTTVTLSANVPSIGTGAWSIVSGAGGSFSNIANVNSTFSGTGGSAYTLRWTITNGSCTSGDDVNITFNSNPTTANAGPDQSGISTCGLTVTLAANTPSNGTGTWTVIAGSGSSFSNASIATSAFTGTAGTVYTLRWTITNSCSSLSDDVDITFATTPTTANAGPDQTGTATCGSTTVMLGANIPTIGTGTWSIISGTGGTVTTPPNATSTFTGTAGTTYTLRWTISNIPCTASTDDVIITFNQNPTASAAGADQTWATTCGLTTITLAGNSPSVGIGAWMIVAGAGGTITTPASATSTFSGTAGTTYTLRWTISINPCTASTDDVVITFNLNPTTANAGADQTSAATCGLTSVTLAANAASVGTTAWSIVSGTGGTVTTPASATSTFAGTAGNTYTLRWTISNSPCTASTDDVVITFNQNPVAPTAQATSIILTPSTTSIVGSFNAASPAAFGYVVIRTSTNTQPSNPVNGTTYTVGSSVLGGYIVSAGTGTTFTASSLWPATQYWFWIYSYNSNFCPGAPTYFSTSPLTGNAITTSCGSLTTRTWIGTGNGGAGTDFNTASNWSPSGIPSSCDSIRIVVDGNNNSNLITMSANATIGALYLLVTSNRNVTRLDVTDKTLTVLGTTTLDADGNISSQCQLSVGTGVGSAGEVICKGNVTMSNGSGSNQNADVFLRGINGSYGTFIFEKDLMLASSHAVTSGINFPYKYIFRGANQTITYNGTNYFRMTNVEVGDGVTPTYLTVAGTTNSDLNADGTYAASITVKDNSTLDMGTRTWNRFVTGGLPGDALSLNAGATIKLAGSTGGQTGSNFPLNFSTYSLTNGTIEYNSSNIVNQTVYAPVTYGNLIITNQTGSGTTTKNLTANVTGITGNLTINSFNIFDLQTYTANRSSVGGSLSLAASATMKLSAGAGGQTGSNFPANFTSTLNAISTVEYYGVVAQNVHPTPVYGHLTISNNSIKMAGNALTIMGNVLIQTSGIFAGSTYNHLVAGNWTNNSSATAFTSSGLVTFNGAALQTIGGTFSSNFNNLTINNSSNVNLAQAQFVNALLTLSTGNLNLASYNLTINGSPAVAGAPFSASKMIIADGGGEVRKSFTANGSYFFPIGDNSGGADYSPVTLSVSGTSYATAWIGASVIDAKHPNNQSTTHFLTRYWRVNQSGIGTCAASVTGTYLNSAADISGTESSTSSAQLNGTFNQLTNPWIKYSTLSTNTLVANSAVITAGQVSAFTGITLAPPLVSVSGGGGTICNGGSVSLTSSVTGDPSFAYAWSPVTGLSSSTVANPTATPSITSAYSVIAYDGNGIIANASAASITVRPRPTGVISGTATICPAQNTNLTITVTGTGPWNGTLSNGTAFSGSTNPITLGVSPASITTYSIATLTDAYCTATAGDKTGTATITVNTVPAISSQPASATKCVAQSQTFSVTATGTMLTYQWRKAGVNITGATSSTYTIASVTTGDAGLYDIVISGTCTPSVTSSIVTLAINTLPAITGQPVSAILCSGQSQTFSVTATGTALTYQWRKAGIAISGATSSSYNIAIVSFADVGNYDVVISGTCTPPQTSTSVSLAVNNTPIITTNPVSQSVCSGTAINFSVVAAAGSSTGIVYQWIKNGTNISGANASVYSIAASIVADAGNYSVTVTICGTTITSTTATLAVAASGTWLGINTNWNDGQNWCGGAFPTLTTDVTIPVTGSNIYPTVTTTAYCRNINIVSAASVINNSTLQIAGTITNSGIFNSAVGAIQMIGAASQTIPANTFQNDLIKNLIISNTSTGVALGGMLYISESLTFTGTGKNLATNNALTLKSTASNTAWVGDMTGNSITGKVTVERYISARKAWRFLSVPTNSTQTVKQAWQEGAATAAANPVPGYGVQVTSNKSTWATDGFDSYSAGGPSVKSFNPATNAWVDIGSTNMRFPATPTGYMTFVRGDRPSSTVAVATVLRTQGNLYTGDQPPVTVNPLAFTAIGNPYASAIDMRSISKTGVKEFFYVWDPNLSGSFGLGAYQTFSSSGVNYVVTPGGGSYGASGSVNNFIQSGQAFFVQGNVSGGSLTFNENAKASGSMIVSLYENQPGRQLRANLYGVNSDNSTYMADGIFINYDENYTNAVNDMDALKASNGNENFSIKTAGKWLSVERRKAIVSKDTIFLDQMRMRAQNYRFEFVTAKLDEPGMVALLEDNYLKTATPVNLYGTTIVNFSVTSVAASYAANRFRIVFTPALVVPLTITSVKGTQKRTGIQVEWVVENESSIKQYEVERSADARNFVNQHTTAAKNTALSNYIWLDENYSAGNNYYRIKSIDNDGKIEYSKVVKVFAASAFSQAITAYPNPVKDGIINLQMPNNAGGIYGVQLFNMSGQLIMSKQINHAAGSSTETISLYKPIPGGKYKLKVTRPDGKAEKINLIF